MKQLNNFIQEKLKISSSSKVHKTTSYDNDKIKVYNITGDYVTDKILYLWGFDANKSEDYVKLIQKWVKDNHVDDVKPAADPETLNSIKDIISDDVLELYDDSLNLNEECQWRLGEAKQIYKFKDSHTDIYAAPDVIALIESCGTLYCLPTDTL